MANIYGPQDTDYVTETFVSESGLKWLSLVESKALLRDGSARPTNDKRLVDLGYPTAPGDTVNKNYVETALHYANRSTSHFLKLNCGRSLVVQALMHDFFIQNTDEIWVLHDFFIQNTDEMFGMDWGTGIGLGDA
jgi:hypothetical protein